MPDLNFQVYEAEAVAYAVAPLLNFRLGVANADVEEPIHTVALRCQIQLEPTRRRYSVTEQAQLLDLFGEPSRWSQTLRTLLWTHANISVPSFTGSVVVDLPVPCSFDFNVAATKYFAGLETGEIPLVLQFSGTIFYAAPDGALQVTQISWSKETRYRLPVKVWRDMMELYYPNSAWLRLRRDVFDRLHQFKMRHAIPTWEQAIERLLLVEPSGEGKER
ncbi:MAG: hypothetical protein HYR56_13740 [Acidobacteria bacterium]|nr:hypothetical protein [Acidobacteriota bacterium]MBI3423963.1 hypothetical protein [Acidobacteriota bacterium]